MKRARMLTADGKFGPEIPMLLNQESYMDTLRYVMGVAKQSHFLHSVESFLRAKQTIAKLTFHTIQADFFNTELMEHLSKTLFGNNVHIPLINVSNLYDYDGPYALRGVTRDRLWITNGKVYKALAALLYRPEESYILYGMMDPNQNNSCLTSHLSIGLSQYEYNTSAYSSALNAAEILEHHTKKKECLFPKIVAYYFFPSNKSKVEYKSSLITQLEDFFRKHFPNATVQVMQSSQNHLVEADISLNFKDGVHLVNLIMEYKFPYKYKMIDGKFVVTLLEINIRGREILEMLESAKLSALSTQKP